MIYLKFCLFGLLPKLSVCVALPGRKVPCICSRCKERPACKARIPLPQSQKSATNSQARKASLPRPEHRPLSALLPGTGPGSPPATPWSESQGAHDCISGGDYGAVEGAVVAVGDVVIPDLACCGLGRGLVWGELRSPPAAGAMAEVPV